MNTSTSLQALAALAALGSAALVSATPADAARGALGPFQRAPRPAAKLQPRPPARSAADDHQAAGPRAQRQSRRACPRPESVRRSICRTRSRRSSSTRPARPARSRLGPSPTSRQDRHHGDYDPTTSTTTSTGTTASHPVTPPCDFNCVKTTITPGGQIAIAHPTGTRPVGFPMRPQFPSQFPGRPGLATSAPTMSPGPAIVAPAVPVATQPSAPAPVQTSCLRQAVTQDGQVVTFDICTNQAVVGPLAQTQTQPQTQTQ